MNAIDPTVQIDSIKNIFESYLRELQQLGFTPGQLAEDFVEWCEYETGPLILASEYDQWFDKFNAHLETLK